MEYLIHPLIILLIGCGLGVLAAFCIFCAISSWAERGIDLFAIAILIVGLILAPLSVKLYMDGGNTITNEENEIRSRVYDFAYSIEKEDPLTSAELLKKINVTKDELRDHYLFKLEEDDALALFNKDNKKLADDSMGLVKYLESSLEAVSYSAAAFVVDYREVIDYMREVACKKGNEEACSYIRSNEFFKKESRL